MVPYKLAKLYDRDGDLSRRWFVGYYYIHPETRKFTFFRIWISSQLKTKAARIRRAREIVEETNFKLVNGFDPFDADSKATTKLIDTLDEVLKIKSSYTRKRTAQTYRCFVRKFKVWLHGNNYDNYTVDSFTYHRAQQFADYLKLVRKLKNRTYNNYIEHMRAIFNELVRREYILRNPFSKVQDLPEEDKGVFAYSDQELKLLKSHFPKNAPRVWLVCQLVYYCAVRPNEIVQLKVKYFNLTNRKIFIPSEVSKNRRQDVINIPKPLLKSLEKLKIEKEHPEYYLVSRKFLPGSFQIAPTRLAGQFRIEADKIGLKRRLYELKHTGAGRAVQAGANIRDIQLHLRHRNLATTEIYLKAFKAGTSDKFVDDFPEL